MNIVIVMFYSRGNRHLACDCSFIWRDLKPLLSENSKDILELQNVHEIYLCQNSDTTQVTEIRVIRVSIAIIWVYAVWLL
jgi:hypothetical protein